MSAAAASAAEFLRALPPEARPAVLSALLTEAAAESGGRSPVPLFAPDGRPQGYYLPPAAADRHVGDLTPVLRPERREAVARAVATPGDTFDMEQFLDELSREDRS